MTPDNFLNNPDLDVFTFGRQPVAIDIITAIKGLTFAETYEQASDVDVDGVQVRLIHYNHLLQAKRAAGRPATRTTSIISNKSISKFVIWLFQDL